MLRFNQSINTLLKPFSQLSIVPREAFNLNLVRTYKYRPTNSTGKGPNTHMSNKAKKGLFHGKDVRFGHSISFSNHKSNRKFYPNEIKKKVWSFALNNWVRFHMTTHALRAIDRYGGIDNYLLALDPILVAKSNYIIKYRGLIASTLYHKGELSEKQIKVLGYHKVPPPVPEHMLNNNDSKTTTQT